MPTNKLPSPWEEYTPDKSLPSPWEDTPSSTSLPSPWEDTPGSTPSQEARPSFLDYQDWKSIQEKEQERKQRAQIPTESTPTLEQEYGSISEALAKEPSVPNPFRQEGVLSGITAANPLAPIGKLLFPNGDIKISEVLKLIPLPGMSTIPSREELRLEQEQGIDPFKAAQKRVVKGLTIDAAGYALTGGLPFVGKALVKGLGGLSKAALKPLFAEGKLLHAQGRAMSKGFEAVMEKLEYGRTLKHIPEVKEEVRKLQQSPMTGHVIAARDVEDVVKHLKRKEYKLFNDIIEHRNTLFDANLGKKTAMSAENAEQRLREAYEIVRGRGEESSERVGKAIINHHALVGKWATTEEELGKLAVASIDTPRNKLYFPIKVKKYSDWFARTSAFGSKKAKRPIRGYAKPRKGTELPHIKDYRTVMTQAGAERYLAKIKDDFNLNIINTQSVNDDVYQALARRGEKEAYKNPAYELADTETKGQIERQEIDKVLNSVFSKGKGKPYPDEIKTGEELGIGKADELYMAYSPEYYKNHVYKADTVPGRWMERAVEDAVDFGDPTLGQRRLGEAFSHILTERAAIGQPVPAYFVPEPIARKLLDLSKDTTKIPYISRAMSSWKRLVLNTAGLPYHFTNFAGDMMNLYREDVGALMQFPEAVKTVFGKNPLDNPLFMEGVESGALSGGIWSEVRTSMGGAMMTGKYSPVRAIEKFSVQRENIPRLMKLLADTKRIQRGEQIVTKTVDIKGLIPEVAKHKVAREALVDYGAIAEIPAYARDIFFPFMTFYAKNTRNWAKYITNHPTEFTKKFMLPYAALNYWNNHVQPEAEKSISPVVKLFPHFNTGRITEEGKHEVIAFQTPVDLATQYLGLNGLLDKVHKVARGEMTVEEAAKKQVRAMLFATPEAAHKMLGPVWQLIEASVLGHDPITHRPVPKGHQALLGVVNEKSRRDLKEWLSYATEKIFAPYMQYHLWEYDKASQNNEIYGYNIPRPLNPKAMVGLRTFDEQKEGMKKWAEEGRELAEDRALTKRILTDYLVEHGTESKKEAIRDLGKGLSHKTVVGLLEDPATYLRSIEERILQGKATSEEKAKIKDLRKQIQVDRIKRVPKDKRDEYMDIGKRRGYLEQVRGD